MLKRLSLLIILMLAYSSSLGAFQGGEWVKVAPAGSGFSILMPGTPKVEQNVEREYSSHILSVSTDISMYLVQYGHYAQGVKVEPARELAANRDAFIKGMEGTLIEGKDISLDGHPGVEFTAESSRYNTKCRIYVADNRLHMMCVGVMKPERDVENVNRFLSSFAFTKSDSVHKP